jgi:hypothetical protein
MLTLLATLVLGATQMTAAPETEATARTLAALAEPQPASVVVDCALGSEFLTDCKVLGDDVAGADGAAALQLAAQIPAATARPAAINGRIKVRLTVR